MARQDSDSVQPTPTQASSSSSSSASASQSNSASASAKTSGNNDNSESQSQSQTASITSSGSQKSSVSGSTTRASITGGSSNKNTTSSAIDPRQPPGGVSMITPAAIDGMTFIKVGNQVTFKWNYTSLARSPSYIDVIATNTVNSQTYTIAANMSFEPTQAVTWDTGEFTKTTDLPFVIATYTLMIYDANSNPTAVPSAGYLGAFSNLQFGVYTPQPYTPLNDFRCATCSSGAMSLHEKQALSVILGTCAITILSFTWFASGFGLF
ncbi:hypothetical protein H2198_004755 [Neophaeococcomyces mojaviensis]|uniref:Uncharacterized protein n=1 Tax=Neophaeococcomyces mojaviensis TaxID=3383035 RepID=A0ACC3A805_9EURO|nr:hypothetical protein H2198_004755 [Knufia sp. JES_112]